MYSKVMRVIIYLLTLQMVSCTYTNNSCPNAMASRSLIRKKRYLAFPDGSTVALTVSTVKTYLTHVPAGWNLVMEIDLVYPLPTGTWIAEQAKRKHHRQKRDFWDRIRIVLDEHNFNGEACVLRSICEAKYHLAPPGKSLVHDLLRAILTAPTEDPSFLEVMEGHYNQLNEADFCEKLPDCPFSLLHMMLDINKSKYSL